MDEYTKKLKLKVEVDKSAVKEAGKTSSSFKESSSAFKEAISKAFASKGLQAASSIKSFFKTTLEIKSIQDKLTSYVSDIVNAVKSIMNEVASWDMLHSSTFNKDAAKYLTEYGLSGSEAYGMNKALSAMGFTDIDDYLNNMYLMNDAQREYMQKQYELAVNDYELSIDTSLAWQEVQTALSTLKSELTRTVIAFISTNKDTIIACMKYAVQALQGLLSIVQWIADLFVYRQRSESSKLQSAYDILGIDSSSSTTKNSNVSINNTFNGISPLEQDELARSGQLSYQQVITALSQ